MCRRRLAVVGDRAVHVHDVGQRVDAERIAAPDHYVRDLAGLERAHFVGDAERLPFGDGSFDAVFCKGSLHHTRKHVDFLANCRRVLKPDGALIMSEPCNDNPLIRFASFWWGLATFFAFALILAFVFLFYFFRHP